MRIVGSTNSPGKYRVEIEVGTEEEKDLIESAVSGAQWIRGDAEGKVIASSAYKPLGLLWETISDKPPSPPEPITDRELEPFWDSKGSVRPPNDNCDFYVQSIAGYSGNYAEKALKLEDVGFSCLRSRRDEKGKYWEIWYLPGKWAAKKELKGKSVKEIKEFLFSLGPGTIVLSGEHWGLGVD
jgi:hypothetical protein